MFLVKLQLISEIDFDKQILREINKQEVWVSKKKYFAKNPKPKIKLFDCVEWARGRPKVVILRVTCSGLEYKSAGTS